MSITFCLTGGHHDRGTCTTRIEHVGAVLGVYDRSGLDETDWYAVAWTGTGFRHVRYATTSGWTLHNGADVDATPEVLHAARVEQANRLLAAALAEHAAGRIDRGARVRSLTTHGKNAGVEGVVRWIGANKFGSGQRVGVRVEGEADVRWMDAARVVRIDTPALTDDVVAELAAECWAVVEGYAGAQWRHANPDPVLTA